MRKTKKASTKLKLLSRFLWLIAFSITLFFIYELNKINILPLKYSLILVGIMILLIFLFGVIVFKKKRSRILLTLINIVIIIYILVLNLKLMYIMF